MSCQSGFLGGSSKRIAVCDVRQASPDLANSYDHGGTAPLWRGAELKLFNGRAKRPPNYSRI
eukprot:3774868-Amphidinium_carterae.3